MDFTKIAFAFGSCFCCVFFCGSEREFDKNYFCLLLLFFFVCFVVVVVGGGGGVCVSL